VIARFEDYKGKYAYHCHILEHEDNEMMRQFQTVLCGDHVVDPTEGCDDGALAGLDGCNSTCDVEEFFELAGSAAGGSVSVTVSGQVVTVTTVAGQTAAQVAQALANAINANTALQALGITATAQGARLIVSGDMTSALIGDAGLQSRLDLRVEKTRLWWANSAGATSYDVLRGSLDQLRSTAGNFASPLVTQLCLANNRADTYWLHAETPAASQGVWYLIRAQPGGTYDSGAPSQSGSRDGEVAASGNACP